MTQPATESPQPRPGTCPDFSRLLPVFRQFCEIVAKLRSPEGCPWDRQQTLASIKPYTLEETYELLEAIDSGNNEAICEELGDVLLQVVLDAQIAADEGRFELTAVVEQIAAKMIRRHPHVFGTVQAATTDDVRKHWSAAKEQEKPARESLLDGMPAALPELARASRITSRAAAAGYDFPDRRMLFDKLQEELGELSFELFGSHTIPHVAASVDRPVIPDAPLPDPSARERAESELGDVLFVLANIGRRWGINPEEALRKSNAKFARRFRAIESAIRAQGRTMHEATLVEMEEAYQAAKVVEKKEASGGI